MSENNTGPVIEVVERLSEIDMLPEMDAVVLPSGKRIEDLRPMLDARLDRPKRARGISTHTTLASFMEHVKRQMLDRSAVFAKDDPKAPRLVAVFNYDDKATSVGERPDHRDHRAHYDFPLSEEWQAWNAISGDKVWLDQVQFAELLEARVLDVIDPASVPAGARGTAEKLGLLLATPAALLTCAKSIAINAEQSVTQAVNTSTGETEVQFAEKHVGKGGAHVYVPSAFALRMPVFRGGAPYIVLARLRYRLTGGAMVWGVRLHRVDLCFREAFDEACNLVHDETKLPVFYGSPE